MHTYVKEEPSLNRDNRVKESYFLVGTINKVSSNNSYDTYKRLSKKIISVGSNQITKDYTYLQTKLSQIKHARGTTTLHRYAWGYDSLSRIVSMSDSMYTDDSNAYVYDAYGQLTRENNKRLGKTILYTYDSYGNMTKAQSYAYTTSTVSGSPTSEDSFVYNNTTHCDRLASFNGKSITYDSNSRISAYDGWNYTWQKGRLTSIKYSASALSKAIPTSTTKEYTFTYNAYGQRTQKKYSYVPGTPQLDFLSSCTATYEYDMRGRLIAENRSYKYSDNTTITKKFTYLYEGEEIVGAVFENASGSGTYYYDKNPLGDVIAIFDNSGNVVVKYKYDAFGNCTSYGSTNTDLAECNPIRYRSYYYDEDTELYYLNARYYNPAWRRFISPDDTAYLDPSAVNGLNLYCYEGNNPTSSYNSKSQKAMPTISNHYAYIDNATAPLDRISTKPLSFSFGLLTPSKQDTPSWMPIYAFYAKGSLGWGYTIGEGYSLASLSAGILDATFHTPKWFDFLSNDHLANPNIYFGVGTWNINASIGVGISGIAEIISAKAGVQFGDSISFGIKGYVGLGFALDFTNGIKINLGVGLGLEISINIDWYELFH